MSTAPGLARISLPVMEKLEASAPSTLNTTASVCGGTTIRLQVAMVWSPLQEWGIQIAGKQSKTPPVGAGGTNVVSTFPPPTHTVNGAVVSE